MTIEALEARMDSIRKQDEKLMLLLSVKEIEISDPLVPDLVKLHHPELELECRGLIEMLTDFTIQNGHCDRSDFIKDVVYGVFGKIIQEDL